MSDMSENKPGYKVAADGHTYHKSASANATEAPTNTTTTANADKSKGLSDEHKEFVTVIDYEWHLKGNIDPEGIAAEYGYTEDEYTKLSNSSEVHTALTERGINVKAIAPDSEAAKKLGRSKLTPIQLIVANAMLDLVDTRPPKKKLSDLGVTPYQYQSWIQDPDFRSYMHDRAEGMLGDVQHEAMLSLIDKVMSGDMVAVKYYHELTGRFVQASNTAVGSGNQHDLQQMIVRIIEIIVDEVDDPDVAVRISERLKGLVMGNQIAALAVEASIPLPEVAAPREMTAEMAVKMEKGIGIND